MTESRTKPLLELRGVSAAYGQSAVLHNINLSIPKSSIVSLIGRNGAGKSSTLRSIVGLLPPRSGEIRFEGQDITLLKPHRIARMKIALVPEDRRILRTLTVTENITIAAEDPARAVDEALAVFPTLSSHLHKAGDKLSGGEQQMVAIARALVSKPKLMLIDEPLEGLAPVINERIQAALEKLRGKLTVLIIEQNLRWLLGIADYHYVIHQGEIVYGGSSKEIRNRPAILDRYIGVEG